jgi:hypothetical protein
MTDTPGIDSKTSWKLSKTDWEEACRLYEVDDVNLVDIADKFDISRQALSLRFKNASIIRGAKKPAPLVAPVETRYADKRDQWIEETRMEGYSSIRQAALIARKIVADAVKMSVTIDTVEDQLRAVHRYNRILTETTAARLTLLNANEHVDESDLPMLLIEDLTDEEILQHHKNNGVFDESVTVEEMLQEELELGSLE